MLNISNNKDIESMSLTDWVGSHSSEDELQSVFLNMDIALKYIHEHGYCIDVFHPSEIEILNNQDNCIQFNKLVELSSDFGKKKKMIQEDLFNSALIQIGIYSSSLKYLTPDFLKENFDSFIQFLPSGDVPYYRGIIQRGASVYLCDYANEKRNRDLKELEKQFADENGNKGENDANKSLLLEKNNLVNDRINDAIYSQINGLKDSAFIYALIIPTIFLLIMIVFAFICLIRIFIA